MIKLVSGTLLQVHKDQGASASSSVDLTALFTAGLVIATILLGVVTLYLVFETRATRELSLVPFLSCRVTRDGFEIKNVGNSTAIECEVEFYEVTRYLHDIAHEKRPWLPKTRRIGTIAVDQIYNLTTGHVPDRPPNATVRCSMRYLNLYRKPFKTVTDLRLSDGAWVSEGDRGFMPGNPLNPL